MIKKFLKYFGFFKEKRVEDTSVKGKPVTDLLSAIDHNFKSEAPPSVLDKIKKLNVAPTEEIVIPTDEVDTTNEIPVTVNKLPELSDKVDSLKSIMEEKKLIKDLVQYQKEIIEKKESAEEKKTLNKMEAIDSFFKHAKTSFTDKEFNERKVEILKFLRDLKNK
jgi:hypothetical protein